VEADHETTQQQKEQRALKRQQEGARRKEEEAAKVREREAAKGKEVEKKAQLARRVRLRRTAALHCRSSVSHQTH
jgi:hypothetical protein